MKIELTHDELVTLRTEIESAIVDHDNRRERDELYHADAIATLQGIARKLDAADAAAKRCVLCGENSDPSTAMLTTHADGTVDVVCAACLSQHTLIA